MNKDSRVHSWFGFSTLQLRLKRSKPQEKHKPFPDTKPPTAKGQRPNPCTCELPSIQVHQERFPLSTEISPKWITSDAHKNKEQQESTQQQETPAVSQTRAA